MRFVFNILVFLCLAQRVHAFPQFFSTETDRCTRCHSTQNGYGLLTPAGKLFAIENWAETKGTYYQVKLPDWISLGFKSKQQQTFYQSDYVREATFKDIQTEMKTELNFYNAKLYFSLGRFIPTKTDVTFKDFVYLSNAYFQFQQNPNLIFKAGKYFLNYGYDQVRLNYDRMQYVLSGISKGREKNQLELNYVQLNYDVSLVKIFSQANYNQVFSENGSLLKINYFFDSQLSFGGNIYQSQVTDLTGQNHNQTLTGVFGLYNWDQDKSILFQADQKLNEFSKKEISVLVRPSYQWRKGQTFLSKLQYINPNIELSDPKFLEFSVGYQYVPHAQFNILAQLSKTTNSLGAAFVEDVNSESVMIDFNFLM